MYRVIKIYLDLLQKQVTLHKTVVEKASRCATVLQEAGRVGPGFWVCPYQLTIMWH